MNLIEIKDKQQMDELVASGEISTFSKAIRAKCYECSAYQIVEVRNCHINNCPLWAFRGGHRIKKQ